MPPRIVTSGSLTARIQGARAINKGTIKAAEARKPGQTLDEAIFDLDYHGLGGRRLNELATQFHSATPATKRRHERDDNYEDPAKRVLRLSIANSTIGDIGRTPAGFRNQEEAKRLRNLHEEAQQAARGTAADGKMPAVDQLFFFHYRPEPDYPYYPAIVTNLKENPEYRDNDDEETGAFPVLYEIEYAVDENFQPLPRGKGQGQTVLLDLDMMEWEIEKPQSTINAEQRAADARGRAAEGDDA